jgi:hypothetical protein
MSHFFYFFGLLIFLMNLRLITRFFNFLKLKEWSNSFQKITKKLPTIKDFRKGDFDKFKKYDALITLNLFWLFLGLITENWKIFGILLIYHILTEFIINIIGEFKIISKFLSLKKFIILTVLVFVLVMNHFHWQQNLYNLFSLWFTR